MSAEIYTAVAYVVVAVLLWGFAGMLVIERRRVRRIAQTRDARPTGAADSAGAGRRN
jgi:hypothetical protein